MSSFLSPQPTRKVKGAQSCPTLCDCMDCSLLGSVHGILQARILEWVAIPSPRDLPSPGIEPRSPAFQIDSLLSGPPGKPEGDLSCLGDKVASDIVS